MAVPEAKALEVSVYMWFKTKALLKESPDWKSNSPN